MVEESDVFLEGAQNRDYTPTIPNLITDLNMDLLFNQEKLDISHGEHSGPKASCGGSALAGSSVRILFRLRPQYEAALVGQTDTPKSNSESSMTLQNGKL